MAFHYLLQPQASVVSAHIAFKNHHKHTNYGTLPLPPKARAIILPPITKINAAVSELNVPFNVCKWVPVNKFT